MAAPIKTPTAPEDANAWELVNDDGFVYKRKKRRLDPAVLVRPPDPAPDPAAEERERRKRKHKALVKIKEMYEREIGLWEHLSNTLKAMEESVKSTPEQQDKPPDGEQEEPKAVPKKTSSGSWAAELLSQVEAQEAIIHDLTHLCDIAESLCNAQEEKANQYFLDLPIWGAPHELMSSLCED